MTDFPRSSGILLHPTSLSGGTLGEGAYRFVDWLAAAGQRWWQVLPLGPPDAFGSPYAAVSAFAGSPALLARPDAPVSAAEADAFLARQGYWAGDWARHAGAGALLDQVRFEREWRALRAYANERGIGLIGDLPIYVAAGGADQRARPELFASGEVAGAPPDALSADGQLWGNPLYDWGALRRQGWRWWLERFRRTFELVDLVRVDHFRGFVAYWAVRRGKKTARAGRWRKGPGEALFRAAQRELGALPLIVENLGVITPAVERLRRRLRLPGMHVLQFGFGGGRTNPHRLENHETLGVVCTGTHDTDTALGWWRAHDAQGQRHLGLDPEEPHWSLIDLALTSRCRLALFPLQDVLGLGSEARMNRPGTTSGNWRWRIAAGVLTGELAARLRAATKAARR